jgi:hypothetical protein
MTEEVDDGEYNKFREEDHAENLYQSCCGKPSDKRLVVLLTQITVSIMILVFSGTMLAFTEDSTDKAIYMSLLSSTLSYWLGKNESEKK